MGTRRDSVGWVGLDALWRAGAVADLTDGQLLERFATRGGETSEAAFAALVERHGAMVLRTCRSVLRDEHDAQDAFQATFLVLVRRGGGLWVRDSVGPWLHRVACRAALRARRDEERRKVRERRAAEMARHREVGPVGDGLRGVVQEEVDRLPDRYRVPIVLCDLEGRTYEEAARSLGCPVGTVKSRLARARDRLRSRLTSRGLAPSAFATLADAARAAVPPALAESTIEAAARFLTAGPASVPASVAAIIQGVMRSMSLTRLKTASVKLGVGTAMAMAVLATGAGSMAQQGSGVKPTTPPKAEAKPAAPVDTYAWRRTDKYEPPDFERFFPDDPEGGKALDALVESGDIGNRPAEEVFRAVRRGLRRMTWKRRESVLSSIGGRYVWGKTSQAPEVIEILYHAADFRGKLATDPYGTRHNAVYYGLSVVQPKPPAVLRTLAELCMASENGEELGRIVWGAESQRDEVLAYVRPFLDSGDPTVREKAVAVEKIFKKELNANVWAGEQATKRARAKYGHRISEIEKALRDGTSPERMEALRLVSDGAGLVLDEPSIAAFAACAESKDEKVRREVARTAGQYQYNWTSRWKSPAAVDLLLRLSCDPSPDVRYAAVYHGLTLLPEVKQEEVARRLLELAISDRQSDLPGRVAWGLQDNRALAAKILNEFLRAGDPTKAKMARTIYKEMTGHEPPTGEIVEASPATYPATLRALHAHIGKVHPNFAMKGIEWEKVGEELLPSAAEVKTEQEFGLLVEEMVARLEDSHAVVLEGTARPPASPDLQQWDPGLACTIDDRGRPVVYVVDPGSPAHKAGVRPGMAVVSVDGIPAERAIERTMARHRKYAGYSSDRVLRYDAVRMFCKTKEKGAKVRIELEDVDGRKTSIEATADRGFRYLPRLPVPRPGINDSANVSWAKLKGGIGYIYVRRIPGGLDALLDAALKGLDDLRGLILDVRGNSGGGFDTNTAFRNFDKSPDPARPHYAGPIAILIDERTISAGEGWASWFLAKKRARFFGSTTAGASCRKETYPLDNGLYQVVVPVKAYPGFLDRPIEPRGLEPDVEVRSNSRDLDLGKDTVAEAAAAWLATSPAR